MNTEKSGPPRVHSASSVAEVKDDLGTSGILKALINPPKTEVLRERRKGSRSLDRFHSRHPNDDPPPAPVVRKADQLIGRPPRDLAPSLLRQLLFQIRVTKRATPSGMIVEPAKPAARLHRLRALEVRNQVALLLKLRWPCQC